MGQHPEEQQPHYLAFISYNRKDEKWAKILQRQLESYRLPSSVCKNRTIHEKRLQPIFRDKTGIKPSILSDELRGKLDDSQYLITICSPNAVKSDWMGMGIEHFVNTGKKDNIIAYIVKGEPYSNDSDNECYHDKLKQYFPKCQDLKQDRQLLGVNINEAGNENRFYKRERASIQIVSKMLDLPFEDLWRHQRRRIISRIIGFVFAIMLVVFSVVIVWAENQPFDVSVNLRHMGYINNHLPFSNGTISLNYSTGKVRTIPVDSINGNYVFDDIPGKYKKNKALIWFEMSGFKNDTIEVMLSKNVELPIERDNTYKWFLGKVLDGSNNDIPANGVEIHIAGTDLTATTNEEGEFSITIPVQEQRQYYDVVVSKSGYVTKKYSNTPIRSDIPWQMSISKRGL